MFYIMYFIIFLCGTVFGSFLSVCIYRLPEKQSIAFPGSHCFSCGHPLNALDLVPVFSYLLLRGKCRYCDSKLSLQYPAVELVAGALAVLSAVSFGFSANAVLAFAFSAGLLIVFVIDKKTMIIPDEMVLFLMVISIIWRIVNYNGIMDLMEILFGMATGPVLLLIFYFVGLFMLNVEVMGLGDIKFFIPIGILLGGKGTIITLYVAVLSGAAAAIYLLLRKKKKRNHRMPFGPYIALGAMLSLYFGNILIVFYWKLFGL